MARKIAPDAQEAIATARFVRMSATKARQMVDLIRGRHVDDARRVLRFTPKAACTPIEKVLNSAVANAENNRGLPGDELVVARAWVDEGPTLKRFRPRAMGRATRINKRTCHISVVVGRPADLDAERPARGAGERAGKKTTAKTTTGTSTAKKTTTGKAAPEGPAEKTEGES